MSRQFNTPAYPLPAGNWAKVPGQLPRCRRPGYNFISYDCKARQPAGPE
jgi:hypothetical protein